MIPILYDTNETAFTSNGIGRLRDCISCIVTEERNGIYECDFEYPVDGARYEDIICGRIIAVTHDDSGDVQPFDIVSYSKPIDGIVTFHAVHISYRLSGYTVYGTNINSLADALTLLGTATPSNYFTYSTDKTSTGYMSSADGIPKTVRQMLGGVEGSILDTYGGEFKWDKFNVQLLSRRGQARDFTIRYGVNLVDYNDDTDYQGTYSAVIPYWNGADGIIVRGDKVTYSGATYNGRQICVPMDLTDKFETKPTKAQLQNLAQTIMNSQQPTLPKQNIHVDFIRLQDLPEFADFQTLLQCELCDTIKVEFPLYEMTGQFKIVKTVWDALADRFESMELGDLSTTLSEALGITPETQTAPENFIIDDGVSGMWNYRKWIDGTAECWGVTSTASTASTSDGGGYRTDTVSETLPDGLFTNIPRVFCSINSGTLLLIPVRLGNSSATSTGLWAGWRASSSTNTVTKYFNFYCIGK